MTDITLNRPRGKKNALGGVRVVYLFPYVKYSRSQITVVDQKLTVFPTTTILDWYSVSTNFNETTEIEGGDVAWNQTFSIELPRTDVEAEVYKLVKQDYRAVYIDYLGNIRILGLYNGLEASITNETGSDKAGFNGWKVSFSGKEDNQAYWIDDLSAIFTFPEEFNNKIFMNGCNAIMQDGNNYIYQ